MSNLFSNMEAYTSLIGFFSAQGPLAGRFKVRPFFYPSARGDPAYVSYSVLENRRDLGRTVRPVRAIQCSHTLPYPGRRFAPPWAFSFCPFWGGGGSMVDQAPPGSFATTGRGMIIHRPRSNGLLPQRGAR